MIRAWLYAVVIFAAAMSQTTIVGAQADSAAVTRPDTVSVRLTDVDLGAAVQALSRYLDRPVVFGALEGNRVTVETPAPVARDAVLGILRGLLDNQGYDLVTDTSGVYQVRQRARTGEPLGRAASPGGAAPQEVPELFVIRLKHARAADVAATVSALYGQASALGEIGGAPPTLGDQLREQRVPPQGAPAAAAQGALGREATLTGDVTIVPDPGTNSLLIRAARSDFELIQAAVQELDVRPLQVLIEVLIVEARRDRSRAWGLGTVLGETEIPGTDGTTIAGSTRGLGLGDLVIRVMGLGGIALDAALEAAAARGDVGIVSRPVILTANNERADILVGAQRPFVQVSRSLPTDTPTRDQVVQYRDVGTELSVRPTVNEGGYVMLEVSQEVNAATTETAFDAPVISTRSVQTRLLVKDGQTIVLGGLVDRQRDVTKTGIPILSEIPILGGLFGSHSYRTIETELFLFLTPRVLRDDAETEAVTEPLLERAEKIKP